MKAAFLIPLAVVSYVISSGLAWGSPPDSDYLAALKAANEKVTRSRMARNRSSALRASELTSQITQSYRVGDWWEIAAWSLRNPLMRGTSGGNEDEKEEILYKGAFRYTVVEVKPGPLSEVVLDIQQVKDAAGKVPDPRVNRLQLHFDPQTRQTRKQYFFANQRKPVPVSPEGIHSAMTPLELFPLDFPELLTAEITEPAELPKLPSFVSSSERAHLNGIRLAKARWFIQDDFFGRPVLALWQPGDPWPAYLKTANGISVLLRFKEGS